MSSVAPVQWAIKPTPSSSSGASPSKNGACSIYVGAEPQQSHQAGQVISCLIRRNLSIQNSDPSSASHFFLFITDSFLKSKAQVLPLVHRLVDPHFKQRLFPVIMEPTLSIYKPGEELPWVDYWEGILNNTNPQSSEYSEIKAIKENIGTLIKAMRGTVMHPLDELLRDDLAFITSAIEKRGHLLQQKRFFFLPAGPTDSPIGLEAPLAQLSALFESQSTVVLTGDPGTGKTTLAIEYAKSSTIYPTGIFWFNAEHLENALETLAVQLGTSKEDAKRELFRTEKALLIFDNVSDRSIIPPFPMCHTLIIGSNLPHPDMKMTPFTDEDAVRLMELNDPQASLLATILGNNPAKISAAKAYIKSRKISVESYISFYQYDRDNLLLKQQGNRPVVGVPPTRRNSIASIVDSSTTKYQNQSVQELSQELIKQEIQIFVSYNWGTKSEAEQIDSAFKAMGIEILRDTREVRPFADLQEFMKKVTRQADYTFSFVTDSYLRSFNCIFEVINLLQDPYWRSRIFPIVWSGTSLDEQVYITHWQQEAARLKLVGTASESAVAEEGSKKIGPFLQFVKGLQLESFSTQLSTNFQTTLAAMLARQEKLEKKGLYRQGIFHLPMGHNKNFTGREREMKLLENSFKKGEYSVITNAGMGGVGKSQLALEYAYRHEQDYEMIYWIRSEDMSTLKADYRQLGQEMGIGEDFLKDDKVLTTVKGELEKRKNWLLIFDNAIDPQTLTEAMPQMGGHALITSRNPNWPQIIAIETFNDEEAVHYLKKISGIIGHDQELSLLAKELGYLPLALNQAGAYIKKQRIDVAAYRTDYKKLLSEEEKGYPGSVATAWLMSIEKIAKEDPNALQLLYFCSYLSPDNIPDTLLSAWLRKRIHMDSDLHFQEALRVLESYSLISQKVVKKEGEHKKLISIHRLIQTVSQDQCLEHEVFRAVELGLDVVNEQFDDDISTKEKREAAVALFEHAKALAAHADDQKLLSQPLGNLISKIGIFLRNCDNLKEAKEIHERALKIRLAIESPLSIADSYDNLGVTLLRLGDLKGAKEMQEKALLFSFIASQGDKNHLSVGRSYTNLGLVLSEQGDLTRAKEMHEKALAIYLNLLGTEIDTNIADIYNNLGNVLRAQGDLKGAQAMYGRALAIYLDLLGTENHLSVAMSHENLGAILAVEGDLKGAKAMFEKALNIKISALGTENHTEVAGSYQNLGNVLAEQGDLKGAKEMHEKALAIRISALKTENHIIIATSYDNLGSVLYELGELNGAKEMHQKALVIYKAMLNTDIHTDIATSYDYLGLVLRAQGDINGAKAMHEKALAIFILALGTENHLSIATSYDNLGSVLCDQDDLKGAKAMHEKALTIRLATLGTENHLSVAESYDNLGRVLYGQDDLEGAKKMHEKALTIKVATLRSENHLSVAKSYNNIGNVLRKQDDLSLAKAMHEEALAIFIALLGTENHTSVAESYKRIGLVLDKKGDLDRAREMYEKALAIFILALGTENHLNVAKSYYNLGHVLYRVGDSDRAKSMLEKALGIFILALGTENHTSVANSYKCLGLVLDKQGNLDRAREMFDKAQAINLDLLRDALRRLK